MSLPPSEIPLGAMRFNSDSQKLEYWNGSAWFQIQTFSPNLDGGARGIFSGGDPSRTAEMDYITIPTRGNALDFGDLPFVNAGGCIGIQASKTRGFVCGGEAPVGDGHNTITKFEFSSTGSAADFANLNFGSKNGGASSNATRAIQHRGYDSPSITHEDVCFFTMASQQDASDFGDILSAGSYGGGGMASPTRGIIVIGYTGSQVNNIEYCTIATTGNFQDFGDVSSVAHAQRSATAASSTRGVLMGGGNPSYQKTCSHITLASGGNSIDFGELTVVTSYWTGVSDSITMIAGGGQQISGENMTNRMEALNFTTGGTAVDCGDLLSSRRERSATSNGHGGLG